DFGRRVDRGEFHLIAAGARSSLGVAAATPTQLLDLVDDRAVFTTPQTTKNLIGLIGLNGNYALTDTWSLQGNLYIRRYSQNHLDHGNNFLLGGSIDYSTGSFNADSKLGFIYPDLFVGLNRAIPGNGAIIHTLGGVGFVPVDTSTRNTYYGFYGLDTFDIDERLSLTAGGRLNVASIGVGDRLGTAPELNSNQAYAHFNPVSGVTYKLTPGLTAYFGYS